MDITRAMSLTPVCFPSYFVMNIALTVLQVVVVLFGLAMVEVNLPKAVEVEELFERILGSEEYDLPPRVHEIARQYKSPRHFRYCVPRQPFPIIPNKVPRIADIPRLVPILLIPYTTESCNELPTDGSVVNLVVDEPQPLMEMKTADTKSIFRSREVVQFMLSHDVETFPVSASRVRLFVSS